MDEIELKVHDMSSTLQPAERGHILLLATAYALSDYGTIYGLNCCSSPSNSDFLNSFVTSV